MNSQSRSLDDLPLAAYSTGRGTDAGLAPEMMTTSPFAPAADESAMGGPGRPGEAGAPSPRRLWRPRGRPSRPQPGIPEWLAKPRQNLRDPRLLLSGLIAVGLVLLVVSLLPGRGGLAGVGANASPGAPAAVAPAPPPVGNASVEVKGKLKGMYELAGLTGIGPAVESRIEATWGNAAGATLGLTGPATSGTRTTDAGLVLTWAMLVDGAPVTFTSSSGECTVGMAAQAKWVTGSFVCKKVKSADGKHVVDVRGTYRT